MRRIFSKNNVDFKSFFFRWILSKILQQIPQTSKMTFLTSLFVFFREIVTFRLNGAVENKVTFLLFKSWNAMLSFSDSLSFRPRFHIFFVIEASFHIIISFVSSFSKVVFWFTCQNLMKIDANPSMSSRSNCRINLIASYALIALIFDPKVAQTLWNKF